MSKIAVWGIAFAMVAAFATFVLIGNPTRSLSCSEQTSERLAQALNVLKESDGSVIQSAEADVAGDCRALEYAEITISHAQEVVALLDRRTSYERRSLAAAPIQISEMLVSGASCIAVRDAIRRFRENRRDLEVMLGSIVSLASRVRQQAAMAILLSPQPIEYDAEEFYRAAMLYVGGGEATLQRLMIPSHHLDEIYSSLECLR